MFEEKELALIPEQPRWVRFSTIGLWCAILFMPAVRILHSLAIYGDDHSSHLAVVHYLLSLLRHGQTDFFCPTFNLGFPMYLYYQPLPHLAAALLHLLSFGLLSEQFAFNLSVVLLWCLYPAAVYSGVRRMGLGDSTALLCGMLAPMITSSLEFGFTLVSYMGSGLYTQMYAMVFFPLAIGWCWYSLHVSDKFTLRSTLPAAGFLVLIWLSHAFYGVAASTAAVVMWLAVPSRMRLTAPRLLTIGGITLVSLLFWFIPLALVNGYSGGWPWEFERWQGYGFIKVIDELFRGRAFDNRQVPTISFGVLLGVAIAIWRFRQSAILRTLVICLGLFIFFLMGRKNFGHLVDIQPANLGLQLFRYIGVVHLFGVFLAGIGLSFFIKIFSERTNHLLALALLGVLLVPPTMDLMRRSKSLFNDVRSYSVNDQDLKVLTQKIDEKIKSGAPAGRIYAHTKTNSGTHLIAARMAMHTNQPMGQSYGVSMHDALGFFFLEYLEPKDKEKLALYNFRYVVASAETEFARQEKKLGNKPLVQQKNLQLYQLPGDYGYFQPVDLSFTLVGAPREIRPLALNWLDTPMAAVRRYGQIVPREKEALAERGEILRVGAQQALEKRQADGQWRPWLGRFSHDPRNFGAGPTSAPSSEKGPGLVENEMVSANRYQAQVKMERAGALALKVGFHPFWQVQVDGRKAPLLMLTPSYPGVELSSGEHQVVFSFHNPLYQKILFLLSLLGWLGGIAYCLMDKFRRRRSLTSVEAPAQ